METGDQKGSPPSPQRLLLNLLLWAFLPLALGGLIAFYLIPRPAIGIVRLNFDIWGMSAEFVQQQIDAAREDPTIDAVVVQIDSPGGEVAPTQAIYMELQKLRQEMPVVGLIDGIAASGGYYSALALDPIFAKPSSTVGNIGVWGYFPSDYGVNEVILASGPFKLTASNAEEFQREIEVTRQEFLATVVSQRGERLKINPADLSQGLAYPGREALELGLVDAMGSQTDAIEKAAELAGLANYEVIDLANRVMEQQASQAEGSVAGSPWIGAADPLTGERRLPPGIYLLYDARLRRP